MKETWEKVTYKGRMGVGGVLYKGNGRWEREWVGGGESDLQRKHG